jgi:EAL domain-containing protein (putative c-di-GMP-specific phosphodiesterase class I)/GGDEF domain-containing protein
MDKPDISRVRQAVLAGACCFALQQWPIGYQIDLLGSHASGSIVHLHAGLLLALAMLYRDRIYLRTAFACAALGWLVRAMGADYSPAILVVTPMMYVAMYGWTVWCARRMGWPRPAAEQRVDRDDVARFAAIGLLLYPLGWAVLDYAITIRIPVWDSSGALNDAVQTLFAKHFGVSVMTMPLLFLLGERPIERLRFRGSDVVVWVMLLFGLGINMLASFSLHRPDIGRYDMLAAILDYRFAIVAILTWCALRLRPRLVMPILMSVQLLLLFSVAQSTPRLEGIAGVLDLGKVAFELSVLQLLIVLLLIMRRDREDLLEHLREKSQHEAITGLRNLNGLFGEAKRMAPPPQEIAYLTLANLDRLAGGFGLRAQEALMQGVAHHLADCVESYHMGTGQFALLPKNTTAPMAWDTVLQRLERYDFRYAGESLRLTPYLGVAALEGTTQQQIDAALDAASTSAQDAALHGETHPVRTQPALLIDTSSANRDAFAVASMALAHVRAREIQLFFHPIKRIDEPRDQPIRYGEILCRLGGADGRLLMPNVFMRELEARGRSVELDLAVIDCLFGWLRKQPRDVDLPRLGINLTGRSVTSDSFRETLLGLIDDAPVAPASLCFEVTETEAIARFSDARRLLEDLRSRGCRIALDDFGIGMQSFERLRELPFDLIKIDGSFVRGIAARTRDYEFVRASVAVAHACGADTVAEYVENGEIAQCLQELGVSWGQGDYFGVAAPIDLVLNETTGDKRSNRVESTISLDVNRGLSSI